MRSESEFPTYSHIATPIKAIYADREAYSEYPKCQRDYVWGSKPTLRVKLIDSILRCLPIPAITVLPGNETLMGRRDYIVDGQQRLKTILDFMDNKFKTGSNKRGYGASKTDEPGFGFIEGDKYYRELSPSARERFDRYPLEFCRILNMPFELAGLIYRRINSQAPLTPAEEFFSYQSRAVDVHSVLEGHEFWDLIYNGKKDRKRIFTLSLKCMLMEILGTFANLTTPRLIDMASGDKDNVLSDEMIERMITRLDHCVMLFDGFTFPSGQFIVPVYQAEMLLAQEGCNFTQSNSGSLAKWIAGIQQRELAERQASVGRHDIFSSMEKTGVQIKFWTEQLPIILSLPGIVIKDKKREFSTLDRLTAWLNQDGLCAICGKPVRMTDPAHHIESHSLGGKTVVGNCQVVHSRCHTKLHADNPTKLEGFS